MKKYFSIIIVLVVTKTTYSQNIMDMFLYDTMKLKEIIFLTVKIDQVKSGSWVGISEQYRITDSLLNTIQISDIKSSGMPEDLVFFEVTLNRAEPISYLMCYNTAFLQFYTLSGFCDNEFKYLFDYFETKGFKISTGYFKRNNLSVSGMDLNCLIPIYLDIKQKKIKALGYSDRFKYPCLKYHFQAVIH